MSSLEWEVALYSDNSTPKVVTQYWELWPVGIDRSAWYSSPEASIRKIKNRRWELTLPYLSFAPRYFKTLKQAKEMGIVLTLMEE